MRKPWFLLVFSPILSGEGGIWTCFASPLAVPKIASQTSCSRFWPLRQPRLTPPAAGGVRLGCPRLRRSRLKTNFEGQRKGPHMGSFSLSGEGGIWTQGPTFKKSSKNKEVSCIVPFPGTELCHFLTHFTFPTHWIITVRSKMDTVCSCCLATLGQKGKASTMQSSVIGKCSDNPICHMQNYIIHQQF